MQKTVLLLLLLSANLLFAQDSPAEKFWEKLQSHCGEAYEGKITSRVPDGFAGKKLVMHVISCDKDTIRIPFHVGDNKSRTWVFSFENDKIKLKHDHRHQDGSKDKVTQYGGTATNTGSEDLQVFPADQYTTSLLPEASGNIWYILFNEQVFSYNLKRIGTETDFSVEFDLDKPVKTPSAPWGWKD